MPADQLQGPGGLVPIFPMRDAFLRRRRIGDDHDVRTIRSFQPLPEAGCRYLRQ